MKSHDSGPCILDIAIPEILLEKNSFLGGAENRSYQLLVKEINEKPTLKIYTYHDSLS